MDAILALSSALVAQLDRAVERDRLNEEKAHYVN